MSGEKRVQVTFRGKNPRDRISADTEEELVIELPNIPNMPDFDGSRRWEEIFEFYRGVVLPSIILQVLMWSKKQHEIDMRWKLDLHFSAIRILSDGTTFNDPVSHVYFDEWIDMINALPEEELDEERIRHLLVIFHNITGAITHPTLPSPAGGPDRDSSAFERWTSSYRDLH